MSAVAEQFESILLSRASQVNSDNPASYAAGYLLSLVNIMVQENPLLEDKLRTHITNLEYIVAANSASNDEDTVHFN